MLNLTIISTLNTPLEICPCVILERTKLLTTPFLHRISYLIILACYHFCSQKITAGNYSAIISPVQTFQLTLSAPFKHLISYIMTLTCHTFAHKITVDNCQNSAFGVAGTMIDSSSYFLNIPHKHF